ncbi:MAG: hypothetical protein ACQGVK_05900 [Myxococcota bacterium]
MTLRNATANANDSTRSRTRRPLGGAFALALATVVALGAGVSSPASAGDVLCKKDKNGKVKIKLRADACKANETPVDLVTPLAAELETRVALVEEAATAPVTGERLALEPDTFRVPGVEGEREVTTDQAYSFCGLTRVLYNPLPDYDFTLQICEVNQNPDGTWTVDSGANGGLFCTVQCF